MYDLYGKQVKEIFGVFRDNNASYGSALHTLEMALAIILDKAEDYTGKNQLAAVDNIAVNIRTFMIYLQTR